MLVEVGGLSGGSADLTVRKFELDGVMAPPNRPDMDCFGVCWALLGNRPNWALDEAERGVAGLAGDMIEAPDIEE